MSSSLFVIEGFCKGALPVERHEEVVNEAWHKELIKLIKDGRNSEAIELAKAHFSAEYVIDNIDLFAENGITFVETLSVDLDLPFVEVMDGLETVLFKWIGARFLLEVPAGLSSLWIETNEKGLIKFSQDKFDHWLGDESVLQDGCCYNLGSCWYDLDGFGENGCNVIGDSVVKGLNGNAGDLNIFRS